MELRQCAHTEKADEFEFDETWSHEQVDHYLRSTVFPIPFGYADEKLVKGKGRLGDTVVRPQQWVLINKEKHHYEVVDIDEPTAGADLA